MKDVIDDSGQSTPPGFDQKSLDRLARTSASLGYDIVEIAGFIDHVDEKSSGQKAILDEARRRAGHLVDANGNVVTAIQTIRTSTDESLEAVMGSVEIVEKSGGRNQAVAQWVQSLDNRMADVIETLKEVRKNNGAVTSIASQVNILAINAKIEAARAGDAGRGFAVVAEAVNELSQKTAKAAEAILESLTSLSDWIEALRKEAADVSLQAAEVLSAGQDTDQALTTIADSVKRTREEAAQIADHAQSVGAATRDFSAYFDRIERAVQETSEEIGQSRARVNGLIDQSEAILQNTFALGGGSSDGHLIQFAQENATEVVRLFEEALEQGTISQQDLFDFTYTPIAGTDPQQMRAPFLALTDKLLPPLLEKGLAFDPKIVFCAAVTKHGYLPTHNKKFSHPQRPNDPEWNAGNARNRRMFDDRVGLKAGKSRAQFLLQIYRRDMGGGEFKMMKDISAPITVRGTHWGGFRMGVSF